MDREQANITIKNLYTEAFSLNPSALVTLFEFDIGQIAFNRGVLSVTELEGEINTIFRFHNTIKLSTNSIFWGGKEYIACPITAEGFEIKSNGTFPTPKISISVSDEGIPYLSVLKNRIYQLAGDLVGAKVTRIRTFAKFLDAENFFDNVSPEGFSPDPNNEFTRDIFFVERKSNENKNLLEFELSSIFDVEGLRLPGRTVLSNNCPWTYRGEGCLYEYEIRRTEIHGLTGESTLPTSAPACANEKDELFIDLLSGIPIIDKGRWNKNQIYQTGNQVFISHNNINYYFVAKTGNVTIAPPNTNYWLIDNCGRRINSCAIRHGIDGFKSDANGQLPFGGFISTTRFK